MRLGDPALRQAKLARRCTGGLHKWHHPQGQPAAGSSPSVSALLDGRADTLENPTSWAMVGAIAMLAREIGEPLPLRTVREERAVQVGCTSGGL